MLIGYARVSTQDNNLDLQSEAFAPNGDHVFRQSGPFFRQPPDRQRHRLNVVCPLLARSAAMRSCHSQL